MSAICLLDSHSDIKNQIDTQLFVPGQPIQVLMGCWYEPKGPSLYSMGQLGPRPFPTLWISLFIFNTDCRYEETGLKTQVQLYTGEILRKNLTLKEDNYAPTYLTTSSICTIFYDISFVQKTCQIRRLSSIVVNIFTKFSQTKILL